MLRFIVIACLLLGTGLACGPTPVYGQGSLDEAVRKSVEDAQKFLKTMQVKDGSAQDGSWNTPSSGISVRFPLGVSGLAVLSLLSSGLTPDDDAVARGLDYLRRTRMPDGHGSIYEVSVILMALATAKDGQRDQAQMMRIVSFLERAQRKAGPNAGGWGYGLEGDYVDNSCSQYAILSLREAQFAGVPVDRNVWVLAKRYWHHMQKPNGSWTYHAGVPQSSGSMTVAGIASLAIIDSVLRETPDENPDGTPICCGQIAAHKEIDLGLHWLERNFSVMSNPGTPGSWHLYYMYGLERAGRLTAKRYLGEHDWYREGAELLVSKQKQFLGGWSGDTTEADQIVSTSLALLFLAKGASPVLINKLKYGVGDAGPKSNSDLPWNRHRRDIHNLTDFTCTLTGWPKLMSWQEVNISTVLKRGGVKELMQAPILYFNGREAPAFSKEEINLLKDFVAQGGFILADAACDRVEFDRGFRRLIEEMYPGDEIKLTRLRSDHPVYRSEFVFQDPESIELWGVDIGCRTSIIYSPHDLGCLWDKWMISKQPDRSRDLEVRINKAMRVGVNIVAYVTGRSPPSKLERQDLVIRKSNDDVQRGQLQIAKLRHPGSWDVAPEAVANILAALNAYAGIDASTKKVSIPLNDSTLPNFPLVYMHGRNQFDLGKTEIEKLREHLLRGGVLFADSCCGAVPFDKSFRKLMTEVFPEHKLQPIPATHEMFSKKVGHDLQKVRRREPANEGKDAVAGVRIVQVAPALEGIEINGRYVVIYSKYDLSCALQRQASTGCYGYVDEDAVKIAVNVVTYILQQ
ncbi:MAG: DUF4159 domain-containing protein [Planctomycetales bacterium]